VTQYQATNQPLQTKPKKRVKLRVERNTDRKVHLSRRVLMSKWKIISKEDSQSIDQNRPQPRLMNRSLRKLLRATDRGARVVEDSKWSIRRRENHRKPRGNKRQVKVKESLETIKGVKLKDIRANLDAMTEKMMRKRKILRNQSLPQPIRSMLLVTGDAQKRTRFM
jgi:hypothetical protein